MHATIRKQTYFVGHKKENNVRLLPTLRKHVRQENM